MRSASSRATASARARSAGSGVSTSTSHGLAMAVKRPASGSPAATARPRSLERGGPADEHGADAERRPDDAGHRADRGRGAGGPGRGLAAGPAAVLEVVRLGARLAKVLGAQEELSRVALDGQAPRHADRGR